MIRGVLLDWRGTLVRDPETEWWVESALRRLQRDPDPKGVREVVAQLEATEQLPAVQAARRSADCSARLHREATLLWFSAAGLDSAFAGCLYDLDFDSSAHPYYEDVAPSLAAMKGLGAAVVVVSDIHFDIRVECRDNGLIDLIDDFVLSFEHGAQKPDPKMFELALDRTALDAGSTLMVGDQLKDAGALAVGIPTLLLPVESGPIRGLDRVVALIEGSVRAP
ncbi:MAG: HAD family hydrolase [Acidimicrobiales bacterium]